MMDSPISDKWNTNKKIIVYTRRKKGTSSGNNVSCPKEVISSTPKPSTTVAKADGSRKIGEDGSVPEGDWPCANCSANGDTAKI